MIHVKHDFHRHIKENSIVLYLNKLIRYYTTAQAVEDIATTLKIGCKTKPYVYGARCSALIGTCFDSGIIDTDKALDIVIIAINSNNQ